MSNIENFIQLANINFCCDVRQPGREQNNVWGRFAVFVAMRSSGYMLKTIAYEFNLTHASVIHGINKHNILYENDKKYIECFNRFRKLTQHENITPKEKLITLIENLPDKVELMDKISEHIIKRICNNQKNKN